MVCEGAMRGRAACRRRLAILMGLAVSATFHPFPAEATELGGMVTGAAGEETILRSLKGTGFDWIRGRSPRAATLGFRWLDDVRYHVSGRIPRPT